MSTSRTVGIAFAVLALALGPGAKAQSRGEANAARTPRPAVLDGCEGEACDCFRARNPPSQTGGAVVGPIPAVRYIVLYARMDTQSAQLGRFPVGTMATPLAQKVVVLDRGAYIVRQLARRHPQLRVGDRVHTLFRQGEGDISVMHKGSSYFFAHGEIELHVIRATRLDPWSHVAVGALKGYAPGSPFQGCLE